MTAENQRAEMFSGDDQTIKVTVTDSADDPVDLSGSDLVFAISDGGTPAVTKTTGDGDISVTGTDSNVAEIDLDSTDTEDLNGAFSIELEETDAGGSVATLLRGTLHIKTDLIR